MALPRVLPTFYRANTAAQIESLCRGTEMHPIATIHVGNPFYLAFTPLLFCLALAFEKITDAPRLNPLKLYLLTVLSKPEIESPLVVV